MDQVKSFLKKIKPLYFIWKLLRKYYSKYKENRKISSYKKYGKEALFLLSSLVYKKNYNISVIEGTLLGLARDKALIPWDDDLDFLVLDGNNFDWDLFEKDVTNLGFSKYREVIDEQGNICVKSFCYKHCLIDFTIWPVSNNDLVSIQYGCYQLPNVTYKNGQPEFYQVWDVSVPTVREIEYIEVENFFVPFPKNYLDVLISLYGSSWKTPNSSYKPDRVSYKKKFTITEY